MADLKISELPILTKDDLQADDDIAVVDYSASETRRLTAKALVEKGVELIDDDSIPGGKIADDSITAEEIAPNAIGSSELADDAVDTAAIEDLAVTTDKLDDQGVTTAKIADDGVTGPKLGPVTNRGLDQAGDLIGIANSVTAGSLAGLTFTEQGLISAAASEIPPTDLPEATDDEIGAIKPGAGLAVQGDGTLDIDNSIVAGDIGGLSFTSEGLCNNIPSGGVFERDAIPIAGDEATETGAVFVPTDAAVGLELDATTGELNHEQSGIAAGTYAGVTVDENGHITAGTEQITQDQLPDEIPAQDISSAGGRFPTIPATAEAGFTNEVVTEAIADQSISRRHFSNISISYIQENQPPAVANPGNDATVFRGCLWLRPSTGTLYMFSGNNWIIVAGGKLAQENLRYCGNINASTGNITALTDEGVAEQLEGGVAAFTTGKPLPAGDDEISGTYFLVDTAGSAIGVMDVDGNNFAVGDLCVCISTAVGWTQVAGTFGGGGGGGASLWSRSGAAPNALLEPINAADNLSLNLSAFIRLPSDSNPGNPEGAIAGSFRWNEIAGLLEVFNGAAWQSLTTNDTNEWQTILAADNPNWAQDLIRTTSPDSDVAVREDRSLVFEAGANTSQVTQAVTASRTWTLPDETGTLVSTVSTVQGADTLTLDCGTY